MAKYKKPDGTEIDLGADVSDGQVKAITTVVEAALAPVTASIADTVKTSLTEALKPVTERLDKVEAGGGEGGDDGADKGKGGKGKSKDDEDPVLAAIGKLNERLDKHDADKQAEQQRAGTQTLVKSYFDKHLPNLKGRDAFMRRAIKDAPKDEAALKALVGEYQAEYAEVNGAEAAAKAFSASPAAEGAKKDDPSASDLEAQKKANLKKLREQGPGGLRPVART